MRQFSAIAAIAVLLSLSLLARCGSGRSNGGKSEKQPPLVKVQLARGDTISRNLAITGEVVATNAVTIAATVEGPIVFCPWREGDTVEAGQKIIEIGRPLYEKEVQAGQAALAVAEAKLEDLKVGARPEEIAQAREKVKHLEECTGFAKSDLERTEKLVQSGSLPGESLDKARVTYVNCETQLAAARDRLGMLEAGPTKTEIAVQEALVEEAVAKLAIAKAKLAECTIHAPFSGIITKVYVRAGDLATAKAPLLSMIETSSLVIRFAVPESEVSTVQEGMEATLNLDAYPERTFKATISRVYPELDRATRMRTVEAAVTDQVTLVPGMFTRVSIALETVHDAVVVPDSAVLTGPKGDKFLFVVANGKASMRTVRTGIEQGHRLQILEGLKLGELVVTSGNETLKDGMQVRLAEQKQSPEASVSKRSKSQ